MTGLDWMGAAACRGSATNQWFPAKGPLSNRNLDAILTCRRCPVQAHCLQHALDHAEVGIWGGLTDEQRRGFPRPVRQLVPCGTPGALARHRRAGERCEECVAAEAARRRENRLAGRQ